MKKIIKKINNILFYGFLFFVIIVFLFDLGSVGLILTSLGSFFASWGLFYIIKRNNVDEKYWIFINIALWLNVFGEWAFYYGDIVYYDKFLHLAVGILITILVYEFYVKNSPTKRYMIFFSVLGMLCIWEIHEYFFYAFFHFPYMGVVRNGIEMQSPLDDTMIDLILGAIGALLYLIFKKKMS